MSKNLFKENDCPLRNNPFWVFESKNTIPLRDPFKVVRPKKQILWNDPCYSLDQKQSIWILLRNAENHRAEFKWPKFQKFSSRRAHSDPPAPIFGHIFSFR